MCSSDLIAFAGGEFVWQRAGELLPRAARLFLEPGAPLQARAGASGAFAYLAVEGGVDTPVIMGSRATHTRSGLGGIGGRSLRDGDVLPVGLSRPERGQYFEASIGAPWLARGTMPVRVILGPQDDYFDPDACNIFFSSEFTLTAMADRMAYRFEGPEVESASGYDIISDGAVMGAIQITGSKKPFVLMADRQPTGGYPKLGAVARADIGRIAQMRPGETCRFKMVSPREAQQSLLQLEDRIAGAISHLGPLPQKLTAKSLFEANLIGGVFDASPGDRNDRTS